MTERAAIHWKEGNLDVRTAERLHIVDAVIHGFLARADLNGRYVQYPMTCDRIVLFISGTKKGAWTVNGTTEGKPNKPIGFLAEKIGVSERALREMLKVLATANDLYLGAPVLAVTETPIPGENHKKVRYQITPEFSKTATEYALWAVDGKNTSAIETARRNHPEVHHLLNLRRFIETKPEPTTVQTATEEAVSYFQEECARLNVGVNLGHLKKIIKDQEAKGEPPELTQVRMGTFFAREEINIRGKRTSATADVLFAQALKRDVGGDRVSNIQTYGRVPVEDQDRLRRKFNVNFQRERDQAAQERLQALFRRSG